MTALAIALAGGALGLGLVLAAGGRHWAPHLPGVATLALSVGLAPVCEEIIFRGGLQAGLRERAWARRRRCGVSPANALTSVAFAAAHVLLRGQAWAAGVLIPSLLLGHVYDREPRLAPVIGVHALYNLAWLALTTA